ncbi:MAG TPA: hypothetical protein VFA89_15465 [Terriglobales bacterium]|nr:hypothetical protein [Terriglobales bacterium]
MSTLRPRLRLITALLLATMWAPALLLAQSDGSEMSLGDLARSLRKSDALGAHTVIDNDNLSQVVQEVENRRLNGAAMVLSIDDAGKSLKISAPDVTCSLSFSAQATPLLTESFVSQNLPHSEIPKIDGPASITGDTLQVTIYNGTAWNLREITVGLTVIRPEHAVLPATAVARGNARLVPAAQIESIPPVNPPSAVEKRSDITVLFHLKGSAAPSTTSVFQASMATPLSPDQEWHWAIVDAKGIPPQ